MNGLTQRLVAASQTRPARHPAETAPGAGGGVQFSPKPEKLGQMLHARVSQSNVDVSASPQASISRAATRSSKHSTSGRIVLSSGESWRNRFVSFSTQVAAAQSQSVRFSQRTSAHSWAKDSRLRGGSGRQARLASDTVQRKSGVARGTAAHATRDRGARGVLERDRSVRARRRRWKASAEVSQRALRRRPADVSGGRDLQESLEGGLGGLVATRLDLRSP